MNAFTRSVSIVVRMTVVASLPLVVAAPAAALTPGGVIGADVRVPYQDLDINSSAGASQLLARLEAGAQRICWRLDHGDLASRGVARRCQEMLVSNAVGRIRSPLLAELYQRSMHGSPQAGTRTADPG